MREYRYLLLDVFTATPLAGNQLAVFLDAQGLSDAEMQALARETNLSETTFCFPGEGVAGSAVRVRIFTTDEELPFAGHPTLGTAAALRWALPALEGEGEVRLALRAGTVPVRFAAASPAPLRGAQQALRAEPTASSALPFGQPVDGEMDQLLPVFGRHHDRLSVAAALGLPATALDPAKPVQTVSTGLPFVVVPLVSLEALGALAVPQQAAARYLSGGDGRFFYVLAPGGDERHWHARMQFYGGEDPATGSAAGCATAYLVHHGYAPPAVTLTLRQGVEMGRPSTLLCSALLVEKDQAGADPGDLGTVDRENWRPESYVRVGGSTVLVAEGRFFLS